MARNTDNYRYAIIPAGAITDARVEPRALQVLCLLGRHANDNGWCRRSQVKMAEELNCGRTTINRAIDLLMETGYIERREEGRGAAKPQPGRQPFASYSYRVRLDRSDEEIQDVIEGGVHQRSPNGGCPSAGTGVSTSGQGGVHQADTRVSISRTPLIEHTPIEHTPVEQKEGADAPPGHSKEHANLDVGLPDWLPKEAWAGYVEMRRKNRHPLTERAQRLELKKLEDLRAAGEDPEAVLDQSTVKSWRGLFPVKKENAHDQGNRRQRQHPSNQSFAASVSRAVDERHGQRGFFDSRGQEIIIPAGSHDPEGADEETGGFGRAADAA